jgi:hypothetical protein
VRITPATKPRSIRKGRPASASASKETASSSGETAPCGNLLPQKAVGGMPEDARSQFTGETTTPEATRHKKTRPKEPPDQPSLEALPDMFPDSPTGPRSKLSPEQDAEFRMSYEMLLIEEGTFWRRRSQASLEFGSWRDRCLAAIIEPAMRQRFPSGEVTEDDVRTWCGERVGKPRANTWWTYVIRSMVTARLLSPTGRPGQQCYRIGAA